MRLFNSFIFKKTAPGGLLSFLLLAACASAFAAGAAPWVWLDANGRQVFSDRPPPPEVPDRRILRQPASAWPETLTRVEALPQAPATAAGRAPGVPGPVSTPQTPAPTGGTPGAAAPQRPASASLAARQQAEAAERERIAAQRADNCKRARSALATLESGMRLATTNAKGEREILDEAGRSAEAARLRGIMASDCAAP